MKFMKRPLSLLLSLLLILSLFTIIPVTTASAFSSDTITVFYTDGDNWDTNGGKIKVYYWKSGESVSWPGKTMTYMYDNSLGQSVYYAQIPEDATGIIFNDNNRWNCQTKDITSGIVNGAWWYCGSYSHKDGNNSVFNYGTLNNTYHDAEPPTCGQDGNIEYYKLDNNYYNIDMSDATAAGIVDPATGNHELDEIEAVTPNCISEGNTAYYYCSNCGKYFSDAEGTDEIAEDSWELDVDPDNHRLIHYYGYPATCDTAGECDYYECEWCGKMFADANITTLLSIPQLRRLAARKATASIISAKLAADTSLMHKAQMRSRKTAGSLQHPATITTAAPYLSGME